MLQPLRVVVVALCLVLGDPGVSRGDVKTPSPKRLAGAPPSVVFHPLSEIAEAEPNGGPAQAQSVGCGNSFRPASLLDAGGVLDEDWVSFTAAVGDLISLATSDDDQTYGRETDTILYLYGPDGVTILAVNDDAPASDYSAINGIEAPVTGTYYARVRGFDGDQGPYRLDITCLPAGAPPANDRCEGAIALPGGAISISGSTRYATNDYDLCPGQAICDSSCTGFYSPGKDVVYRFVGDAGREIDVTYQLQPATADASLYVVSDCGDVRATCAGGQDGDVLNDPERLRFVLPHSGTYYLILDGFESGGAEFTLTGCVACVTPTLPVSWGRIKTIYR